MGGDGAYKHGSEGVQRLRAQVLFDIVDIGRDAQAAALSVVTEPLYQRIRSRKLERLCIGRLLFSLCFVRRVIPKGTVWGSQLESLILAQNERWRHA